MTVYCWGNTVHGELGLGGIEEELILTPREMTWPCARDLIQAACGYTHTLLLTKEGKVFSCGNNDHGQLGHELSRKRPRMSTFKFVAALDNYFVTEIKCGASHSLALNEWGQIFSWGSDSCGQLGQDSGKTQIQYPKIIKHLATKQIVQIAVGYFHCLAVTNNGELYSWGSNKYGQLGLGTICERVSKPTEIKSLAGIPIAKISCGANHSFAISKSGAIFGWGKNSNGQLGLNDEQSRPYPTQLKTLRSLGVRYIACGEDFSVFLTMEGGVFTCGAGTYGQLGHGSCGNEIIPRMVVELMGSTITQITCGSRHTLALVASRGRVYGFGLGSSGQLGARNTKNSLVPQVVLGSWVSPSGTTLFNEQCTEENLKDTMTVSKIFSGGDHCLVSASEYYKKIPPDDYRVYDPKSQILCLTIDLAKSCSVVPNSSTVDLDLLSIVESIFKSQACINGSFLLPNDAHFCCTSNHHGVDMAQADEAFAYIRKIENDSLKQIIWDSITNDLFQSLIPSPADVETLRIYIILPFYHEFVNVKNYLKLHSPFCKAITRLHLIPKKILFKWWSNVSFEYFENMVNNFKSVAWYLINMNFDNPGELKKVISYEPNLYVVLELLLFLFRINYNQPKPKIPYDVFHIPEILDTVNIQRDYVHWIGCDNPHSFFLSNYPFIFDARAKTVLLQTDQTLQMRIAMQGAANQRMFSMFMGEAFGISQFVVLNICRENLVASTLRELSQYGASDLKKPLKVRFNGEEAEDAGGVRKEFFMLLLKDILDPKYGMFKEFEDSRSMWFSDISFEAEEMFLLIGVLCGLAIYNFTIINLKFPLALYKKLLNEPIDISDLRDLSSTLANSMQSILDYDKDDLHEVFLVYFEISREIYGATRSFPLKPNGDKIPVTQENKAEFVELYIDFIFNKSVEKQFKAFSNGFLKVCGGRVLEIFRSEELMAAVVGNEDYDWHALQSSARYQYGYSSSDQTIQWFWEVFHELSLADKKKFLLYLTGSDRIPIQGMKAIEIVFQPICDEKYLPVAHTCFNLLDLPKYKTKERLKYKLLQALQQTQGFSIV